jgi:enoyl-CoA hydratase/carnithine racemase
VKDSIVLSVDKQVCVIKLNRPECLNAVNRDMVLALNHALGQAISDENVRAILLCGDGRAFCSGNDLKDHVGRAKEVTRHGAEESVGQLQNISRQIVSSDKFVVGAIQGWAVGAGFEWAINCDFSVWAEDAVGFFPELSWGLFPTGGVTNLLPQMVGVTRARQMLLLGERFAAKELHAMGVASVVVPADQVLSTATDLAHRISELPQRAAAALKRSFSKQSEKGFEDSLDSEAGALVDCILDSSTLDRIASFR